MKTKTINRPDTKYYALNDEALRNGSFYRHHIHGTFVEIERYILGDYQGGKQTLPENLKDYKSYTNPEMKKVCKNKH